MMSPGCPASRYRVRLDGRGRSANAALVKFSVSTIQLYPIQLLIQLPSNFLGRISENKLDVNIGMVSRFKGFSGYIRDIPRTQ